MNELLDMIFNSDQYLNDNILVTKEIIKNLQIQKETIIKCQAGFLEVSLKIKSEGLKERMEEQQRNAYTELLILDKKIEENEKLLNELEITKKEIL